MPYGWRYNPSRYLGDVGARPEHPSQEVVGEADDEMVQDLTA